MKLLETFWLVFKIFFLDLRIVIPAVSVGIIVFVITFVVLKRGSEDDWREEQDHVSLVQCGEPDNTQE